MSLPNFFKVSDELCRGAQPDREGFIHLWETGVKTVINLRALHTDRWFIRDLGFSYHHIWMKAWHPEKEDIREFLTIMATEKLRGNLPVFVHCALGSERTGAVIASYRIRVQGWNKEEAIKEMSGPDFGFDPIRGIFLVDFIRGL
jgi:tyrosine-protein phosphatase SIW14